MFSEAEGVSVPGTGAMSGDFSRMEFKDSAEVLAVLDFLGRVVPAAGCRASDIAGESAGDGISSEAVEDCGEAGTGSCDEAGAGTEAGAEGFPASA